MNTYIAYERGEISVPLNLLFNQVGRLDINDSIGKYFSLSYRAKENRLILYAGKYIGCFRLNDLIVVNVRPKFDISNLKRILLLSDNKIEILNFLYANYERSLVDNFSQSLIIKVFNERLLKIYSEGFLKEYILKEESSASIRGRVNINRSMQKHWSRGEINKVEISYYNYTEDNIFNKVIKKSIELLLQLIKDGLKIHDNEVKSLLFYYSLFDSVDSNFTYNEYLSFKDKIYKISSLRDYYIPLCQICNLIIEKKGIDFNFEMNGDEIANSFILNMESVFEGYLLNVLSSSFKGNLTLKNGNKTGKKKLFNDADHDAQPDYILYENSIAKIILDAKYKSRVSESDRYQIISHSLSYNCKIAVLILPLGSSVDRLKRIGTIGEEFKITLYEYYFDLTSRDLEYEEFQLIENIKQILVE
ncbi:McrC family protein [Acinetobacter baumannii]|nr:McrC family protein [Acinetobacter baumannii]